MPTTSIPGGGDHNVTVYGQGSVSVGDGNNSVVLGSGTVIAGNGNDTLSVMGNGTVIAGSGNDKISVLGSGQISVGSGNDTLSLTGSGQINQTGASGNDTINLGNGSVGINIEGNATVYGSLRSSALGFGIPSVGQRGLSSFLAPRSFGGATISGGQLQISHTGGITHEVATSGTMTLAGSSAPTEFVGGSGTTFMKGGSGHDTFIGGSGHDTMAGVGSHNVFEFLSSAQGGNHVITNFVSGDQINVDGHSLSYLLANSQVTTHDGNSYISADDGKTTIEIQGVTLTQPGIVPHVGLPIRPGVVHTSGPLSASFGTDQHANPMHTFADHKDKLL